MLTILHAIFGLLVFTFLIYSFIIFINEKEKRASIVCIAFSLTIPTPFIAPYFGLSIPFYFVVLDSTIILFAVMLLYNPKQKKHTPSQAINKIDERTVMFSRNELQQNSDNHKIYYKEHPKHIIPDTKFRAKPGLLNPQSAFYNNLGFKACNASFETIETLFPLIKGTPAKVKTTLSASENSDFVINWSKKLGALNCGITQMHNYHFYSHKGRGIRYGETIENNHEYGIAFTVEMSEHFTTAAPYTPIIMESAQQYLNAGVIATQIACFIRSCGYQATAHIDGNYEVVCPLVAKDAGLGEIGRMGLLMTPNHGPRVRIAVITTDMPLVSSKPFADFSMISFCSICKKCAHSCPSKSISLENRITIDSVKRWQINQESCYTYWCTIGTDCGRCMHVCPYSHPNNFLHNLIRFGIKNSLLFRHMAVYLDDIFYGKRPKAKKIPNWIPTENKKRKTIADSQREFLIES